MSETTKNIPAADKGLAGAGSGQELSGVLRADASGALVFCVPATDVHDAAISAPASVSPVGSSGGVSGGVSGGPVPASGGKSSTQGKFRFENRLFVWFALGLLFFSVFLLYRLFNPFINTIILACIFSAVCHPLYMVFMRLCGHKKAIAAGMIIACWILFVVLILVFFIVGLTPQAVYSVNAINDWLAGAHISEWGDKYGQPILDWLKINVPFLDLHSFDLRGSLIELSRQAGQIVLNLSTYLLTNTVKLIVHFFLMLLLMFMFLVRGEGIMQRLEYLFPLKPEQTQGIMRSLQRTAKSVLVGGFLVAAAQGVAAGIAFAIVGLPALFWGTVMIFAAFVPAIGTALIWFPAAVYLLLMGSWKSAVFLFVWCGVGVSSIDTFLRPYLLRGGNNIPVVLLFLSIIGGLNVFGALGLLYGPMILGFVAVMLDIYSQEFHMVLSDRRNNTF